VCWRVSWTTYARPSIAWPRCRQNQRHWRRLPTRFRRGRSRLYWKNVPILRGNRLRMYTLHHSLFEVKYRSAFRLLDSIISLCCYRAALYATRSFLWQRCLSVRPPVRLSVTRVNCDKTNESSADILTPYERKIHLLFWTQKMVAGGCPLVPEILGSTGSIISNRKSTTSFPMSLRWTSYPASNIPQRGSKNAKWPFFAGFRSVSLRKSATKLLYAKTVSSRVVRHLLAYLSVHK